MNKKNKIEAKISQQFSKNYPLLSRLIKNPKILIPLDEIAKLNLEEKLKLVEQLSQYIINNPEDHILHLQTLFHLAEENSLILIKMSLLSLAEVMKDIAPLYELNEGSIKEKLKAKLSKDDRKILMYELAYLEYYNKYLKIITSFLQIRFKKYIKDMKIEDRTPENEEKYRKLCKEYNKIGLLCITDIFSKLYYMSGKQEIANLIVAKMNANNEELQAISRTFAIKMLEDKNPAIMEVKLALLTAIGKLFNKTSEDKLNNNFLDCVLSLDISVWADLTETNISSSTNNDKKMKETNETIYLCILKDQKKKKKLPENRKKENKHEMNKLKKELAEDLVEAQALPDAKKLKHFMISMLQPHKQKVEILKKLFYIFFKILKKNKPSKFFNVAMKGILKYIHLINHELIYELLTALNNCSQQMREYHIRHPNLSGLLYSRLACLFTSIEIVNQIGKVIELDEKETIREYYLLYLDLLNNKSILDQLATKEEEMIIALIEKIFINKRQLSNETVASFIKIILSILLKLNLDKKAFISTKLFIIKMLLTKYAVLGKMLDEDNEGFGLDMYNIKIDDPQATNASKSCILEELKTLNNKFSKEQNIVNFIKKISNFERLNTNISTLSPREFYQRGALLN